MPVLVIDDVQIAGIAWHTVGALGHYSRYCPIAAISAAGQGVRLSLLRSSGAASYTQAFGTKARDRNAQDQ